MLSLTKKAENSQNRKYRRKKRNCLVWAISLFPTVFSKDLYCIHLTLSQTTNFRLFQSERVCRRQFYIGSKWQKVLQKGRKQCGKRRNCSLRVISPFPTLFSKDLYCRHVKTRACLGKGWKPGFPNKPCFYVSAVKIIWKHCGKRRNFS